MRILTKSKVLLSQFLCILSALTVNAAENCQFEFSLQAEASKPRVGDGYQTRLPKQLIPASVQDSAVLGNGVVRVDISYTSTRRGYRTLLLPSMLTKLKSSSAVKSGQLKVILLAGNSGPAYAETNHSLAFRVPQVFASARRIYSGLTRSTRPLARFESKFDDGTIVKWSAPAISAEETFRTAHVEVFVEKRKSPRYLIVRPIGDYNEVGDVGVAILDFLELPSKNLVLVHDSLNLAAGKVILPEDVSAETPNNAVFSVTRNLAYGVFPEIEKVVLEDLPERTRDAVKPLLRVLEAKIAERAEIRSAAYLGEPQALSKAIKNSESLLTVVLPILGQIVDVIHVDRNQWLESERSALREKKSVLFGSGKEGLSAEAQIEIKNQLESIASSIRSETALLQTHRDELLNTVRGLVKRRLQFAQLLIGTKPEGREILSKAGFVLSPADPEIFNAVFWDGFLHVFDSQIVQEF